MKLTVVCRVGRRFAPYLLTNLREVNRELRTSLRELTVALIGDVEMARLHEQFLGIAGPTDVLTFPMEQDASGRDIAGEVAVCVPEARRRATENGNTVEQEVLLYALHGILHLSGFDDKTAAGFRTMHRKEDEILRKLGMGPLFIKVQPSLPGTASRSKVKAIRKTKPVRRVAGEF